MAAAWAPMCAFCIAVCYDHVVVTPSPPGAAARAAGLQL